MRRDNCSEGSVPVSVHPFKSRASSECEKGGGIEVLKDV